MATGAGRDAERLSLSACRATPAPARGALALVARARFFQHREASHPNASRTSLAPSLTSPLDSQWTRASWWLRADRPRVRATAVVCARRSRASPPRPRWWRSRSRRAPSTTRARRSAWISRASARRRAPRATPPARTSPTSRTSPGTTRRFAREAEADWDANHAGGFASVRVVGAPPGSVSSARSALEEHASPRRRRPARVRWRRTSRYPPGHPARGRVRGRREKRRGRADRRGRGATISPWAPPSTTRTWVVPRSSTP